MATTELSDLSSAGRGTLLALARPHTALSRLFFLLAEGVGALDFSPDSSTPSTELRGSVRPSPSRLLLLRVPLDSPPRPP